MQILWQIPTLDETICLLHVCTQAAENSWRKAQWGQLVPLQITTRLSIKTARQLGLQICAKSILNPIFILKSLALSFSVPTSHCPGKMKGIRWELHAANCLTSSNKGQPFYICSAFHLLFFPSRILIISTFGLYFNLFLSTRPYPSALMYALIITRKQINKPTNHPSSILKNNKNSTPPPHPTPPPKNTLENSFLATMTLFPFVLTLLA